MKTVLQRVSQASVEVDGEEVGRIDRGLLVYLGVGVNDTEADAQFIAAKLVNLRVFADENDKMNLSVQETGGSILLVSQFTLYGDCRKGRRPGFDLAAEPVMAKKLYEYCGELIRGHGVPVENGIFAASMKVASINDGPATFIIES